MLLIKAKLGYDTKFPVRCPAVPATDTLPVRCRFMRSFPDLPDSIFDAVPHCPGPVALPARSSVGANHGSITGTVHDSSVLS